MTKISTACGAGSRSGSGLLRRATRHSVSPSSWSVFMRCLGRFCTSGERELLFVFASQGLSPRDVFQRLLQGDRLQFSAFAYLPQFGQVVVVETELDAGHAAPVEV